MNNFHLQITTPDGLIFDGEIQRLLVRTQNGDVGILANHIDYVTPIGIGVFKITAPDGNVRTAACSGGILSVKDKITRVIANTFEWAEDIDVERAKRAKERAEEAIEKKQDFEEKRAEIKLKKALARLNASGAEY